MYLLPIPYSVISSKLELFTNNDSNNKDEETYDIFSLIIFFISFYAAYLSWEVNTKAGYSTEIKLACSFVAFNFGIFYIIYYFAVVYSNKKFFKHHCNNCKLIKKFSPTSEY